MIRTWANLYDRYELDNPDGIDWEDELELAAFVYSAEALVWYLALPFNACVALKKDAEVQRYGREIFSTAIWALTHGHPVNETVRQLVWVWACPHLRIADEQKRGRPEVFEKAGAVCASYEQKKAADPQRKIESIIKELEREFGLKRRRILKMLEFREAFGFTENEAADP